MHTLIHSFSYKHTYTYTRSNTRIHATHLKNDAHLQKRVNVNFISKSVSYMYNGIIEYVRVICVIDYVVQVSLISGNLCYTGKTTT